MAEADRAMYRDKGRGDPVAPVAVPGSDGFDALPRLRKATPHARLENVHGTPATRPDSE